MVGVLPPSERSEPQESASGNEKFDCPLDFIPFVPVTASTTETLHRPSTELWLIKAPLDFNPKSFKSQKIPLIGFKSLKIKNDGKKRYYNIFSSPRETEASHLIIPSSEDGRLLCGPAFQGYMNICDRYGDASAMLHPIPARPFLQIPQGLKPRFQPFGAVTPAKTGTQTIGPVVSGARASKGDAIPELDGVKTKKKKRRRKHEDTGVEQQACMHLEAFAEDGFQGNPSNEGNDTEECRHLAAEDQQDTHTPTKKRKKKKREKERAHATPPALEMEHDLEVDSSPVAEENLLDNADCPAHGKKKKKSRSHELVDERFAPTAAELSSVSHKKKKKLHVKL